MKGKVKEKVMVHYNIMSKFGKQVSEKTYTDISKYDGNGNKIEVAVYDELGPLEDIDKYKYDFWKGNRINYAKYIPDGLCCLNMITSIMSIEIWLEI